MLGGMHVSILMGYQYPSNVLNKNVSFHVLLPNGKCDELKTIYFLHGAMEDGNTILQNSNIDVLCDQYQIAVIIPSLENSFYVEQHHDFIIKELLPYTRQKFHLSHDRKNTYIGGYSMGGFGAFYNGLKRCDIFSKIVSISGALDIGFGVIFVKKCGGQIPACLYENKKNLNEKYGLNTLLKSDLDQSYYLSCGKEDLLTYTNKKFIEMLRKKNIKYEYFERDGNHDWDFWKREIKEMFIWLCND